MRDFISSNNAVVDGGGSGDAGGMVLVMMGLFVWSMYLM